MSKKILVVDDNASIREPLCFLLEEEGYEVDSAENGAEALEKIRSWLPNLVFLDVMMPIKSGYEVCQEVKADEATKHIHVIMLTARGQQVDREKSLALGANEYMAKPYSPAAVLERVKILLGVPAV